MPCDLHTHSTASDGTDLPADLPRLARDAGLDALALTDHDTTAGLHDAARAADQLGLAFVPGIELSADPGPLLPPEADLPHAPTLHILGYFIQPDSPSLRNVQLWLQNAREQRNPRIVQRLNDLGVRIDYDQVLDLAQGNIVGRPHIAQLLLQKGYVKSLHEAFARYIGESGAAFVPKQRLAPHDAVAAIHDAHGLAVLAHPVQLNLPRLAQLEHLVARLRDLGLDGLETHHPDHRPVDIQRYASLAHRLDLLTTGGSDYHGSRKSNRLGRPSVPSSVYHELLEARDARQKPATPAD